MQLITWRELGRVGIILLAVLVSVWSLFGGIMLAALLAVGVMGVG